MMLYETNNNVLTSHNKLIIVNKFMDHSSFIAIENDTLFHLCAQLMHFNLYQEYVQEYHLKGVTIYL